MNASATIRLLLRGAIFESWVMSELHKSLLHSGSRDTLWFYRDQGGLEVDAILERSDGLVLIEAKSGHTYRSDMTRSTTRLAPILDRPTRSVVVYGGEDEQRRSDVVVLPWREAGQIVREPA